MKNYKPVRWLPLLLVILLAGLFSLQFYHDNKYQTPPPYGKSGVITLTEADLRRSRPLFLIDGWLLTDSRVRNLPTYIGEYSNLQRGDHAISPHGQAVYQLTLRYSGEPVEAAASFLQLFSRHTVTLDGRILSQGRGGARVTFTLTPGDHLLTVETESSAGYYSGMYHPPALGKSDTVYRTVLYQCVAYSIACFAVLALTLYTLALWRQSKDRLVLWFGLLCCFFSLYVSYYFVRLFSLPLGDIWYLVQSAALYGICYSAVRLTALSGGIDGSQSALLIRRIMAGTSALLLALALLIPALPWAVWLHGYITDMYYIFTFCAVLFLAICGSPGNGWESRLTQLACVAFGAGLICNLFASNLFEPILYFWQFEWCGLLLVVLFGAMLAARNKRILSENAAYEDHLKQLEQEKAMIQLQMDAAKLRLTNLKDTQEQAMIYRHDIRHHLSLIEGYAAEGNIEKIKEYLSGTEAAIDAVTPVYFCSNETVNLILTSYDIKAKKEGVILSAYIKLPDKLPIPDTELCSLLSNALENAVTAAARMEDSSLCKVYIRAIVNDSKLLISTENAYTGNIEMSGGLPKSQNKEPGHGLGVRSMVSIVERYGGFYSFEKENGVFVLRLLLPLER